MQEITASRPLKAFLIQGNKMSGLLDTRADILLSVAQPVGKSQEGLSSLTFFLFSLSFSVSLSLYLPLLLRIRDAYISVTCSYYKYRSCRKLKNNIQVKEKIKPVPFITFGIVFSSHAVCMREILANAHVFCLDGDVVP